MEAVFQGVKATESGDLVTADEKVFLHVQPASDGFLHLQFTGFKETAFVNGIMIIPGVRGETSS